MALGECTSSALGVKRVVSRLAHTPHAIQDNPLF